MKKSDLISVILIAGVGTVVAFFLVNSLLGNPDEKIVSFRYIPEEIGGLTQPDEELFNDDAINPTVEVYVGACIDSNQDGELSTVEKIECGEAVSEEMTDTLEKELNVNNDESVVDEGQEENDDIEKTLKQIRSNQTGDGDSGGTSGGE